VPLEGKFLLTALVIVMITLNVIVREMLLNFCLTWVCSSFIVQKLVVNLSKTSTMLFPPVAKTLMKCLRA
jgi:hypothetical protein